MIELIEEKKKNKETTTVDASGKPGPDYETNLMDALQASLERAKKENPQPKKKRKTTAKKKVST